MKPAGIGVFAVTMFLLVAGAASAADEAAPVGYAVSADRLAQLESEANRSPDALLELALGYDERRDHVRAAEAYRQAAAQGVGVAELRLGALHEIGTGVPQSYVEARLHYERAISLGVPEASLRLGMLYLEGWSVPADSAAAVTHVQRAAEAGYQPAQQILADMYFAGVKVPRDLKKALAWAERAAADRDPAALTRVGRIHHASMLRPDDLRLAREWYQLSAEQDYTRGMLGMASTFLRRNATPDEIELGLRWLELAASGGNAAAAFHLSGALLWPRERPLHSENVRRARELLKQAASAGEPAATEVLEVEKEGRSLPEAFRHVMTVPFDDRYVQRIAANQPPPGSKHVPPRPTKVVRPVYPAAMRLTQTEGEVLVEFVVDTTGRVREAKVVSATHPAFGSLAAEAVQAWRFLPGRVDGRLVNVKFQVPVYFRMSDVGEPNRGPSS